MKHLAQSALLTLFLAAPVALAQTGTSSDSTSTAATTSSVVVTTPDHTGLWGLLGLLGLAGLAGLRRPPVGLVSTDRSGNSNVRS